MKNSLLLMTYLIKKNSTKKKAHIWNNKKNDSYCKMYSTGGLGDKDKLKLTKYLNRDVCTNCKEKYEKIHGNKPKTINNEPSLL